MGCVREDRRCRGEDGTSLLVAMGFLGLLSVSVLSMLVLTMANYKTSSTVRTVSGKTFGADGGADVALQMLRSNPSYCPDVSGAPQTLPSQDINGVAVDLTCQTISGTVGGTGGAAAGSTQWW